MGTIKKDESRTLGEYLLSPGLTTEECNPGNISIKTRITKSNMNPSGSEDRYSIKLNIPITSAIMQSVSDDNLAISLAQQGGLSFIFASQSIENQCNMVRKVKSKKAGFVLSDSNLEPTDTLATILKLKEEKGHSIMPVTDNGEPTGKLLGMITSWSYRIGHNNKNEQVKNLMTPLGKLICSEENISLTQANELMWEKKVDFLPIITKQGKLRFLVFKKDYEQHKANPNEILDDKKRFLVGAGVNTRDYKDRIPALIDAGADILCIDSSDGYSEYSKDVIEYVRSEYGDNVKIGAGNVISEDGFNFLVDAGADFIKVGIGGGSICITREQKGIGCGQATAVIEVVKARDKYCQENNIYIPICSDGGIVLDNHVSIALALGADFVMMGRYFARFDEAPGKKTTINGNIVKEYWGEGSNKAKNWQRYYLGGKNSLGFEEGVDSYVPYAGLLAENVKKLAYKIRSTMSNCGVANLSEFHKNAVLRPISQNTMIEGGSHDISKKE